jgi:hypothetical protein
VRVTAFFLALISTTPALADMPSFDQGRLLATGGVSQVEGAAGGGLASWALVTGYGTDHGVGANLHYTGVVLPDYNLQSAGIGVGLFDRLELSYAWQGFDTQDVGTALGLGKGYTFMTRTAGCRRFPSACSTRRTIAARLSRRWAARPVSAPITIWPPPSCFWRKAFWST